MREYTVPAHVQVPPRANLTDAVGEHARQAPATVLFSRRTVSGWVPVSAAEFAEQVRGLAAGLLARGVAPGDRVALLARTRYEWTLTDYAIWTAGAVTVPIYETSSAEQIEWILADSGAVLAVVETPAHAEAVGALRSGLPALRDVVVIDQAGLDELARDGAQVAAEQVEARRSAVGAADLATVIYTSGTTGRPKGCELTHGNVLFDIMTTTAGLEELFTADSSTLLFLPLAHVFARVIQCGCVLNRVRLAHTADTKSLLADLAAFSPTFVLSVPRVFEKLYDTARQRAHAGGKGAIFDRAESVAIAYSQALDTGGPGWRLRTQHRIFDALVYAKLRAALGGKVRYAVSGGAPLGARLGHFFRGVGITILEGYGLTETTAGATVNTPGAIRIGSVGRPAPGVTVRIAEDSEILLRGANVFRGYWHNPDATAEALDADGFFRTGDLGALDDDGYLTITGRKKELIVTAGGKNVAPAVLEDRLRAHPLVSQCIVVGDQRPFIGALVTIDPEVFPGWAQAHGYPPGVQVAELREDPTLRAEIAEAVAEANKAVSHAEAIKAFRILPVDFTEEGGQLTPTLKLKRAVVLAEFSDEVAAIYG